MEEYLPFILMAISACGAGIVQRTTGFGFGIFLIPLLTLIGIGECYAETISLSTMLAATLSLITVIKLREYVALKRVLPLLFIFMPISYLAGEYMLSMKTNTLKVVLGLTLIALSIYFTFFQKNIKLTINKWVTLACGTVSGIMGGMFSMQGPPLVLYYLATESSKTHYMAQCQTIFFLGNLFMTCHRATEGIITSNVLKLYLIAIVGTLIGLRIGEKIFDRIDTTLLRKIVYAFLAVSGVIILAK